MLQIFWFLIFAAFLICVPAQAHTYNVEIKPAQSETKTATCDEKNKLCFLTLEIQSKDPAQQNEYIDIAISFSGKNASFQFMKDREFLLATTNGKNTILIELDPLGNATKKIKLYKQHPLSERDEIAHAAVLRISNVLVAEIQIKISPEE